MNRVLIVEDNVDNMEVLEAFLEDDFELLKAINGKMGLEMAQSEQPDAILLDISLPIMDGLSVISKIREDVSIRETPVVALTAHAMSGDRERFLNAGFDEYVSKPIVDAELFMSMIDGLIEAK